jgi:glycolate oxidase
MVGIVTEVTLKLLRKPEATRTFLAIFPSTDEGGNAVSGIIAAGILPAAIEMMDSLAIRAAKAATGLGWPETCVLLMDADGPVAEVEHVSARAIEIARACGATEIRVPKDEAERQLMWKGRKSAFAAVGRISPNYMVEDGVIPRSEIARVLREIEAMAKAVGLRVANVFHAGDGNLHPLVLYDARVPGEEERAARLGGDILRMCVRYGGSITGEHGVGAEKAAYMADMFGPDDLETMQRVRCAFDGDAMFNPGKVFPSTRLCGEKPGPYRPHPAEIAGQAERW